MATTITNADLRASLSVQVADRVDAALADPTTRARLTAAGIPIEEARWALQARTFRALAAEAGIL